MTRLYPTIPIDSLLSLLCAFQESLSLAVIAQRLHERRSDLFERHRKKANLGWPQDLGIRLNKSGLFGFPRLASIDCFTVLQTCWEGERGRARERERERDRWEAWRPSDTIWIYTNQGASSKHLKAAVIWDQICGYLGLGLKILRFLHISPGLKKMIGIARSMGSAVGADVGGASDFWCLEICTSKSGPFEFRMSLLKHVPNCTKNLPSPRRKWAWLMCN